MSRACQPFCDHAPGCTNCDGTGAEKSWCEIKNPGCVNEEHDGGWAWCKPEPAASTCADHGTDCDKCLSDKGCWMMTTGDCMSNDQMIADVVRAGCRPLCY